MSRNENEDYYENKQEKRLSILKRLGIALLIVLGIIVIFFMLKGCEKPKKEKDLYTLLLEAGKEHYEYSQHLLPTSKGDCRTVSLKTLVNEGLIDKSKYSNCADDNDTTYVKACKLESGKIHFVAFLDCVNDKTEDKYGSWSEGTESNIISDSTDVKYLFKVEYLNTEKSNLGEEEELWEDEITFLNYKTELTTKYYRYKDLQYIWNITTKNYYPSNKTDSKNVKEYYITSPSKDYTYKDNENKSVSKYFSASQTKEYWKNENGIKAVSMTAPDDVYIYSDNPISQTRYRTRTWTEESKPVTAPPTQVWYCSNPNDVNQIVSSVPCEQNVNSGYTNVVKSIYTCDGGLTEVGINGTCYQCTDGSGLRSDKTSCGSYSTWSSYSTTSCNTASDLCDSLTITAYNWYKLVDGGRKYYPSNSNTASGEKTYYAQAPANDLIKDSTTTTTGWKWYKSINSQTKNYYTTAPQSGATKTGTSKWTEFTQWSTNKPANLGTTGTRIVETKNKIKLKKILDETEEWLTFNEEFLELKDLLIKLQEKGYKVYSLDDINLSGELRYKVKLYIRNKEVKGNE